MAAAEEEDGVGGEDEEEDAGEEEGEEARGDFRLRTSSSSLAAGPSGKSQDGSKEHFDKPAIGQHVSLTTFFTITSINVINNRDGY